MAGVVCRPRRHVSQPFGLIAHGLGDIRPPVSDLDHEQTGQSIEVPFAGLVPEIASFALCKHGDRALTLAASAGEVQQQMVHIGMGHHRWECTSQLDLGKVKKRYGLQYQ